MNIPGKEGFWALTEKEKQTLRLLVRGHDAKSTANSLGLSVHTINERLRDARRKLAVSSSREAARLLLNAEGGGPGETVPNLSGDTGIGGDATHPPVDLEMAPISGDGWFHRHPWIISGVSFMTVALGLFALASLPQLASAPPTPAIISDAATVSAVSDAAHQWLGLVDQNRWDDSYRATGASFRKLNTLRSWTATSETMRTSLGAMISRTFVSEEDLPAPPHGYEVVKFRTSFASKADTLETVTLDREGDSWRVVGVTIG